ncbi:uncharacterized protein LOC127841638 isoform X2 [Dreissena polymorpha]|uniref:Uncharacterized protein n=1 Tax=Dreissena polymorpha TaxID=45954 RepID=A0A9D4ELQ2_DREPO|nr:uncharacterized protein LOC127841638 isoform X2 [Dreissena polymorpha]KAH3781694.1 hypothetical protein DPMN_159596 [Dreissena polymorpha]
MLAFSEVLKNIYTFANILTQAYGEDVKEWKENSLHNAQNWAKYCENVEKQTRGKPYRSELNQHIEGMTVVLNPAALLHLNLDILSKAQSYLIQVLSENPFMPQKLIAVKLSLDPSAAAQQISTCTSNMEQAPLKRLICNNEVYETHCTRKYGQYLLSRLVYLHNMQHSAKRLDRFLEKLLSEITSLTDGWSIAMFALLGEVSDIDAVESIKEKITQIVFGKLSSCLHNCPVAMLCVACCHDDIFTQFYLSYLEAWGKQMTPVYGSRPDGSLYHWRHNTDESMKDYFALNQSIKALMNSQDKRLCSVVKLRLKSMADESFVNVWRDLLKVLPF